MLAYRTDEDAGRLLIAELEGETARLHRENVALATRVARTEVALEGALRRLSDAGAGGGRSSARRDRIALGAGLLALVAIALIPLHVRILSGEMRVQAMLESGFLVAPAAIAAGIAFRYRHVSLACWLFFVVGAGITGSVFLDLIALKW